jgi:hypothetical protein
VRLCQGSPARPPGHRWFLGEWLDYKSRWRNYLITPTCEPDRTLLELGYRAWHALRLNDGSIALPER